jgi:hypothetical protein
MASSAAAATLQSLNDVPSEPHLLADYFELRCLISADGFFTISELEAALKQQGDTGRAGSGGVAAAVRSASDAEVGEVEELLGSEEVEEMSPVPGDQVLREALESLGPDQDLPEEPPTFQAEELTLEADSARELLETRSEVFGRCYPFEIEGPSITLRKLTANRRMYLFLLIASSYKYLARGADRDATTKGFERLSLPALRRYFGKRLDAYVFGTGATRGSRYHGDVTVAIDKMLADTLLLPSRRWEEHKAKVSASGDRGLDLVGWVPFAKEDPADLRIVIFGQCATGRNWEGKQFEASRAAWARTIDLGHPLTQVLFISFAWRDEGGQWEDSLALSSENILFDRERIVHLLADTRPPRHVGMAIVERFVQLRGADML